MLTELSNPWYAITLLGAPELWVVFAALLFGAHMAFRRGRLGGQGVDRLLFILVPAIILTFVAVFSLKGVFGVPRQCVSCITDLIGCNQYCPLDSSFPSGHAATIFAGLTVLWIFKGMRKKWLLLYAIGFLVAASRIMLGVHTWTDVFAGAVLGMATAFFAWEIDKRV